MIFKNLPLSYDLFSCKFFFNVVWVIIGETNFDVVHLKDYFKLY